MRPLSILQSHVVFMINSIDNKNKQVVFDEHLLYLAVGRDPDPWMASKICRSISQESGVEPSDSFHHIDIMGYGYRFCILTSLYSHSEP
jgi:hypothetical protein